MHEMSIALAVIEEVEEAAQRAGDVTAVRSVRLEVGELAGVVPDALSFSFEVASAGTVMEGADLVVDTLPGRARCGPCAHEWAVGMPPLLSCPRCDGATAELLSGRELRIADVRWESGTTPAATREPILEER
ncbi:hydrogenase maturation nickel metallochaperone HypA [Streptomyces sp. NPDC051636]|uniref:hydrogenase maturation nickel metallochaperone HypA n=1 Tax=Streptomyces sp. NPDC051636 TaxID=3365663 RepID=UPI0037BC260F